MDTIGNQYFVPFSEVSLTQPVRGFQYISGRRGTRDLAAEHIITAFSDLKLLTTHGRTVGTELSVI